MNTTTTTTTYAAMLRKLAKQGQYGHSCHPHGFYMGDDYCSYYHSFGSSWMTFEQWQRVAALSARYLRFYRYLTETLPQWREVERLFYMDNSVEVVQEDRDGNRRRVMVESPHGDLCF